MIRILKRAKSQAEQWAELTVAAQRAGAYDLVAQYQPRSKKDLGQSIANLQAAIAAREKLNKKE